MTTPLNDFISNVRTADSIETEKYLIATEQAQIRAYLRKMDQTMRPRIVSKLVFLDMIGQNPAWGQMEAITLMTNDIFSYKRVGYICTAILLDQTAELTVLVTQTLLRDLQSVNPNIQALALTFIANLGTAEVCRSVATEVQKLLESRVSAVMKRAGMATVRCVKLNPDLSESFKNSVQSLLNHPDHGVVIAGINLVIAMLQAEPKLVKSWAQFSIPFTKILKSLTGSRPTREFSYGVFNDPYMQIKSMQALALLRKRSDELDGILQQIISSTEARRNTGRAILYQAVETIVAVSKKSSLRGLAFNQVGRLLSMRDPNVLYSALSSFARVLYNERAQINRGGVDSMALQRYKTQIVKCLDHKDPSIRRRALDVISALIDEQNVTTLVPEILAYVKLADAEFHVELVSKIYTATLRFAPSNEWKFDTVHQILIDSGNYVSMDIVSSFCESIANTPELQQHAVQKLSESLLNFIDNQTLMQVSAYVIGEFAQQDNGVTEFLQQILLAPQTSPETKNYIVTAFAKLAARFGTQAQIIPILQDMVKSNNLELQQRSGELMKLLLHTDICEEILAPVAASNEAENDQSSIQIQQTTQQNEGNDADDDLLNFVIDKRKHQTQQAAPVAPQQTQPQQQAQASNLLDMLDLGAPKPAAPTTPAAPPKPQSTELLRKGDFIIFGQCMGNPTNPKQLALRLLIYGTGSTPLNEFKNAFQVAPGWQLNAQPPDQTVLQPSGGAPITQVLYLFNMNNSPFQMHVQTSYKFGSQPLTENGIIRILPPTQ